MDNAPMLELSQLFHEGLALLKGLLDLLRCCHILISWNVRSSQSLIGKFVLYDDMNNKIYKGLTQLKK